MFAATHDAKIGKRAPNRVFTFNLVRVNMDQQFIRRGHTTPDHTQRSKRLINTFVRGDDSRDASVHCINRSRRSSILEPRNDHLMIAPEGVPGLVSSQSSSCRLQQMYSPPGFSSRT